MGYFVCQVGHLGSESAAPVRGFLTEAAGPVDVADEPVERGRVFRDKSPKQNPEEHVLAEAVRFWWQVDKVWTAGWPAVRGDAGWDISNRFRYAGKGQEGVEQDAIALAARLGAGLSRKTQPGVTPRPGFVGEGGKL